MLPGVIRFGIAGNCTLTKGKYGEDRLQTVEECDLAIANHDGCRKEQTKSDSFIARHHPFTQIPSGAHTRLDRIKFHPVL